MAAQARLVEERELQKRLTHVDTLVGELQKLPDLASRALVEELLSTVLDLHGEALARMIDALGPRGEPATDRLLEIAHVRSQKSPYPCHRRAALGKRIIRLVARRHLF